MHTIQILFDGYERTHAENQDQGCLSVHPLQSQSRYKFSGWLVGYGDWGVVYE